MQTGIIKMRNFVLSGASRAFIAFSIEVLSYFANWIKCASGGNALTEQPTNRLVQGEVDSTVCDVSQTLSLRQMSKYRCTDDSADASRHVYGRRIGILPSSSTKYIFSNFPSSHFFLHLSAHIPRITHSSFTWKKLQLNSRWGNENECCDILEAGDRLRCMVLTSRNTFQFLWVKRSMMWKHSEN